MRQNKHPTMTMVNHESPADLRQGASRFPERGHSGPQNARPAPQTGQLSALPAITTDSAERTSDPATLIFVLSIPARFR